MSDIKDEIYVYLDFGGKFTQEMLQQPIFVRVANLHKQNPLVQLNENIYKGTYDYSLGTNLFFEITPTEPSTEYFDKKSSISLNYILNQTKVVNLQLVKVRPRPAEIPIVPEKINYNFQWDYNTLLEKFANGTLDINDFIKEKGCEDQSEKNELEVEDKLEESYCDEVEVPCKISVSFDDNDVDQKSPYEELGSTILKSCYNRLRNLARRPTKREVINEVVAECDPAYKDAYEYHNIEKQILQPSEGLLEEKVTEVDRNTLSDCVDINRCVLYGLLDSSEDYPRILTSEEKRAVLRLDNFDNLSLAARYCVLCDQVKKLEKIVSTAGNSSDEFGRTPSQTLKIYKKLKDAVGRRICDIKSSLRLEQTKVIL